MGNATWKTTERVIANRLGGRRVGVRGIAAPDVMTSWASVEVKVRKHLPAWLKSAVQQAEANALPDTLPLVVLHELSQQHNEDLVIMRLRDFERLLNRTAA